MSSILTNNSAMVALQTLKGINANLTQTQAEISTGKSIASAKDNSAVWAISKVMEADVNGFKAISDSLSLGESTVAVARQASETITDLLTDIKGKIVAAQEDNVDRTKIQTDISALRDQITSVVNAAQFNGLNLTKGTEVVDVLSSLDRGPDGTVTASSINVERQNLTQDAGVFGAGSDLTTATLSNTTLGTQNSLNINVGTVANSTAYTVTLNGNDYAFTSDADATADEVRDGLIAAIGTNEPDVTVASGTGLFTLNYSGASDDLSVAVSGTGLTAAGGATSIASIAETVTFDEATPITEGDSFRVTVGGTNFDYVAGASDSYQDVANALAGRIGADDTAGVTATVAESGGNYTLQLANTTASDITAAIAQKADGTAGGGLETLSAIDVSNATSAEAALANIEGLIQTSIDAAAAFGSAQGRIETQSDFIGKLSDALKSGIGAMVDADMEAASARLQALQVQQQLGTQALSIANQSPQNILSLFR